jgi:hypothetical protein
MSIALYAGGEHDHELKSVAVHLLSILCLYREPTRHALDACGVPCPPWTPRRSSRSLVSSGVAAPPISPSALGTMPPPALFLCYASPANPTVKPNSSGSPTSRYGLEPTGSSRKGGGETSTSLHSHPFLPGIPNSLATASTINRSIPQRFHRTQHLHPVPLCPLLHLESPAIRSLPLLLNKAKGLTALPQPAEVTLR